MSLKYRIAKWFSDEENTGEIIGYVGAIIVAVSVAVWTIYKDETDKPKADGQIANAQWYQGSWHVDVNKTLKANADNIKIFKAQIARLVTPLPINLNENLELRRYKFYKNHGSLNLPGANINNRDEKHVDNISITTNSNKYIIGVLEFKITPNSDSSANLTLTNPEKAVPNLDFACTAPTPTEFELVNDPKKGVYIEEYLQIKEDQNCDRSLPKGNEKINYQNLDFNVFLKKTEEQN